MKRILLAIPLVILIVMVVKVQCKDENGLKTASTISVHDSIQIDSLSNKLDETIETFDSLKPLVDQTISKIKYYESLRDNYEKQVARTVYKTKIDSSGINSLRLKLSAANNEIIRLKNDLAATEKRRYDKVPNKEVATTEIEKPDDNSIVIKLDGRSRNGNLRIEGLTIYLIPFSRKAKQHMRYETSCDEKLYGNQSAKYYNGLYFFNSVQPGKYLIKICTYYGNFRLIEKQDGKYNVSMQVSPPIQ